MRTMLDVQKCKSGEGRFQQYEQAAVALVGKKKGLKLTGLLTVFTRLMDGYFKGD
jgi:hypothetical protein